MKLTKVGISGKALDNPVPSITYFFVNHPIHGSRTKLWELYKRWIHFAAESPDGQEIGATLFFYNQLVEMLKYVMYYPKKLK